MTHEESFLHAIREEPENDAVRLIFADWLEDRGDVDRAEFIRVECALARAGKDDPQVPGWKGRAQELLKAHWEAWLAPLRALLKDEEGHRLEPCLWAGFSSQGLSRFHRGFIDSLRMHARTLLDRGTELLRHVPLRQLWLWGAGAVMGELARCPHLASIEFLSFDDFFHAPLDAEAMRTLAGSPHLGRLRSLGLSRHNLSDPGVEALASAPWLSGIRELALVDNGLSVEAIRALTASPCLGPLTYLDLGRNPIGDEGAEILAGCSALARLRTLMLTDCNLTSRGLTALRASPVLRNLASLQLDHNPITSP
jgi:uncharacterized protein (TIGR02996 family)